MKIIEFKFKFKKEINKMIFKKIIELKVIFSGKEKLQRYLLSFLIAKILNDKIK